MPLRLLHLSDIHFSANGWDEDADQRNELLRDLRTIVAQTGPMDAVLVGGDIAFSAKPDEYQIALAWIDEVLEACGGLSRSQVWTVPGNHDIDRSAVTGDIQALDFRLHLATCAVPAIDFNLRQRLSVSDNGEALMKPLQAYNDFAMTFGCAVLAEAPSWFDESSLDLDGWRVRLTGINSVLTSGAGTEKGMLSVGKHQCRIERKDGVIDIVMMHHPPEWIRDWDQIAPLLRRAHIWLFGHAHEYAAVQQIAGGSIEITAGAVAPERDAEGERFPFVATYNVITLNRSDADELLVEIQPRSWNGETTTFAMHSDGISHRVVALRPVVNVTAPIPLPDDEPVADPLAEKKDEPAIEIVSAVPLAPELPTSESTVSALEGEARRDLRRVSVHYLGLPVYRRREIAKALGVVDTEEFQMRPAELYPLILRRIRDAGLIDRLIEELEQ